MKKKLVVTISFLAFTLSLFAQTVQAANWTPYGVVKSIEYHSDLFESGDVFVFIEGFTCSKSRSYLRIFKKQVPTEQMDAMVRLLTASKLSGEVVALAFNRSSSGATCKVHSVSFGKK